MIRRHDFGEAGVETTGGSAEPAAGAEDPQNRFIAFIGGMVPAIDGSSVGPEANLADAIMLPGALFDTVPFKT